MLRQHWLRTPAVLKRSFTTTPVARMASPFTNAVAASMRQLYPECLADKSFDNTGLLLEAPFLPQRRNRNAVLLTIDLTKAVADEAIENKHSVVVAYHPIIFRALKSLTLEDSQQQSLLRLASHGISVYSPHTAVDIVPGGMADWLCDIVSGKVDAPEAEAFTADPQPGVESPKSEVSVTTSEGDSSSDAPSSEPTEPTTLADQDPFSSTNGTQETPKLKQRFEITTQTPRPSRPKHFHRTYSKPTYPRPTQAFHSDSIPHTRSIISPSPHASLDEANTLTSSTHFTPTTTGAGRLITFSTPQPLTLLITRIAHAIGLPKGFPVAIPQSANVEDLSIKTVGVCPGSGASVISRYNNGQGKLDLVFTGEMSHHDALAITERGGCVISLFHSNSERGYLHGVMKGDLEQKLKQEWEKVRLAMKEEGGGKEGWGDGVEEILEDEGIDVEVSVRDRDPFGIVVMVEAAVEGEVLGGG